MSAFVNGVQNANKIFDLFAEGQVALGNTASNTGVTSVQLSFAPDWVLALPNIEVDGVVAWAVSGTTSNLLKFTVATASTITISYIAGNLS